MLMTEKEARGQICPLIRYCVNELSVAQDGASAIHVHQNCQASDCKPGWRWRSKRSVVFSDRPSGDDGLIGSINERQNYEGDEPRGYCGAFGRPEV